MSLAGKIALVTGASRGVGRGIARQLGKAKATVYLTALKLEDEDPIVRSLADKLPTLQQVADEVENHGGIAYPFYCDHRDSKQVREVFEIIANQQNDTLDILVSNAFGGVTTMMSAYATRAKFWELPESVYDAANNAGLRGHYITARRAAKLMVPRRSGLIVTTSSAGALHYTISTAYGVNKACCDRLAADMAVELRDFNVTSVSLWPSFVKSELFTDCDMAKQERFQALIRNGESLDFSGKTLVALASDANMFRKTGRVLPTVELAREYGIREDDGTQPRDPVAEPKLDFIRQLDEIRMAKKGAGVVF